MIRIETQRLDEDQGSQNLYLPVIIFPFPEEGPEGCRIKS